MRTMGDVNAGGRREQRSEVVLRSKVWWWSGEGERRVLAEPRHVGGEVVG
jgi:hypothetical protein